MGRGVVNMVKVVGTRGVSETPGFYFDENKNSLIRHMLVTWYVD